MVKITFEHEDGSATVFERGDNGTWYAQGFQPMSPSDMLDHLTMWVDLTYRVPR